MCHVITFLTNRNIPPAIKANAAVSPIEPLMLPKKDAIKSGAAGAKSPPSNSIRGVAEVMASTSPRLRGAVKAMVIGFAYAAIRMARPANAGFKKLWPKPPKSCLTSTIAANDPITGIHSGNAGGRVMASNKPVITALPSLTVMGLPVNF
jgi:hypothetical protein